MKLINICLFALVLLSCEVVLWQEPSVQDSGKLRKSELTLTKTVLFYTPGDSTVNITGQGLPTGLALYAKSTPGTWAEFDKFYLNWEDGTETSAPLNATLDVTPPTSPFRIFNLSATIPLRSGSWVDVSFKDNWGYSSPKVRVTLTALP